MRLIYLMVPSLLMTFSLAQAEQSTGTGYSEREACRHASSAAISDMVITSMEFECKDPKNSDCDGDITLIEDYYTTEDCACIDRTPEVLNDGKYNKSKRNPDRWACAVNYYKIPGKW